MKKISYLLSFAIVVLCWSFMNPMHGDHKEVDTTNSIIEWTGYKVGGQHTGTLMLKGGSLVFNEEGILEAGGFVVDMASLKVTDIKDEATAGKLAGHLGSEDFFGVKEFPTANFKITKAISYGEQEEGHTLYRIIGEMTIKDQTNTLKFNAKISEKDGIVTAMASPEIDRSEFDVRYGSGSFIDNLGDKVIYDEFKLDITLKTK